MKFLFVAAVGAALLSASPSYSTGQSKHALFAEKKCWFYLDRLEAKDRYMKQEHEVYMEQLLKQEMDKADETYKGIAKTLTELAQYASIYSAFCKP